MIVESGGLMRSASPRKRATATILVLILVAGAVLAGTGCGERGGDSSKVQVVATIYPMADFARAVGGDRVEVTQLLPSGASPHTFEPSPSRVKDISAADVFVQNGLNLDSWAESFLRSAGKPGVVNVVAASRIPREELLAGEEGEDANPHVWLDPRLAIMQVEAVRDGLISADAEHEAEYRERAQDYISRLERLEEEIAAELAQLSSRDMVTFHASLSYYIRRFGLNEAAVIEEFPGKEPTPQYISEVVDTIRSTGVRAVFAEPQFSPKAAEVVAEESGVGVYTIDPEGGADPNVQGYVELMQLNTSVIVEALG
ncbi:MAG: metal ABC transporter substrate-binding protein [Candidatus Geothermincolia bacterium]